MHAGRVHDEVTARDWIIQMLDQVVARFEAPITLRLIAAFTVRDARCVRYWTDFFIAARDSAEFRAETLQMGYSLGKLLPELVPDQAALTDLLPPLSELPFPTALAAAAVALQVNDDDALLGMLFSWAENQVLACVKSVPLGQVAGQRLLLSLGEPIEHAAQTARQLPDDALSNWTPGLSLMSMQHEVQYSRLYRS
ncbi:MAG: urease accessory protein UreF [Betaproteobacteria bacterium]|nr:urease accessory protein UreF [Betaproteobacteria bacterium]